MRGPGWLSWGMTTSDTGTDVRETGLAQGGVKARQEEPLSCTWWGSNSSSLAVGYGLGKATFPSDPLLSHL